MRGKEGMEREGQREGMERVGGREGEEQYRESESDINTKHTIENLFIGPLPLPLFA